MGKAKRPAAKGRHKSNGATIDPIALADAFMALDNRQQADFCARCLKADKDNQIKGIVEAWEWGIQRATEIGIEQLDAAKPRKNKTSRTATDRRKLAHSLRDKGLSPDEIFNNHLPELVAANGDKPVSLSTLMSDYYETYKL